MPGSARRPRMPRPVRGAPPWKGPVLPEAAKPLPMQVGGAKGLLARRVALPHGGQQRLLHARFQFLRFVPIRLVHGPSPSRCWRARPSSPQRSRASSPKARSFSSTSPRLKASNLSSSFTDPSPSMPASVFCTLAISASRTPAAQAQFAQMPLQRTARVERGLVEQPLHVRKRHAAFAVEQHPAAAGPPRPARRAGSRSQARRARTRPISS